MSEQNQPHPTELQTLKEIRDLMEKSSRFISLSGLSGIAAGVCALAGTYLAALDVNNWKIDDQFFNLLSEDRSYELHRHLFVIAGGTFVSAFLLAVLFTWLRSKKRGTPVWRPVAKRLLWSIAIPVGAGALFIYRMVGLKEYDLIAPASLIFYGLSLVNASKYTFREVRYLGYIETILGLVCCWSVSYGIYFWAVGFGAMHIIYGSIMWWKYERK